MRVITRTRRSVLLASTALVAGMMVGASPAGAVSAPGTEFTSKGAEAPTELPVMSADGTRSVFVGRGEGKQGVWLVDRTTDTTYRLTSGMHFNPDLSDDGTTVAFAEYGTNRSVWVMDVTDPSTPGPRELVSRSTSGQSGNGLSDFPSLSADGTIVAFQSMASNLTPETPLPTSGGPNKVYVRDLNTDTTEMVSVDNSGAAQPGNAIKPDLSDDGRYVAFASEADLAGPVPGGVTLAEEEPTTTFQQIWVRDRTADTTVAVSVNDAGDLGDAASSMVYGPSISNDGMRVAFESDATNLVAADTNGSTDTFVRDLGGSTTTRVSERTPFDEFGAFTPVSPARLLDTRDVGTKLGPGETLEVTVPTGAAAVALNVAVTEGTAGSYLTVFPAGEPRPTTSNLNFGPGQTTSNAVVAKVGAADQVSIFNAAGDVHVIVDLNGTYDGASVAAGGGFFSTQPTRVVDTRDGGVKVGPGETLEVPITGVPTSAVAVALNVAATDGTAGTFLTAFPTGESLPLAANLNVGPYQTVSNEVVVKLGTDQKVSIFNAAGEVHVIVDLNGWFDSTLPGGGLTSLTPDRLLDTREGDGIPVGPGETRAFQVTGVGGVPAFGVTAVALNVAVTQGTAGSYLTVFPSGKTPPLAANLNFAAYQTTSNQVLVQVGADGMVSVFNALGDVHVVVDVLGWYSGVQVSEGGIGPAISGDGTHVAFESMSSTLTDDDTNGVLDAFVRDLGAPLTERVSVVDETAGGTEATGTRTDGNTGEVVPQKNGADVAINLDGNEVAFTSNGNLANDRVVDAESGGISTEPAVFTRTRS